MTDQRPTAAMPSNDLPHADIRLLAKLGSIAVHVDEMLGETDPLARAQDRAEVKRLLRDPDITGWLAEMRNLALVPEKRSRQ